MEITEVRIFVVEGAEERKLKAYATVTFDNCFVVRDIKVIEGKSGPFVAMPSRRLRETCPQCGHRNVVHSRFCNQCGSQLSEHPRRPTEPGGGRSEHRDIAHPIKQETRDYIQQKVLEAYEAEKAKKLSEPHPPARGERRHSF